jgi:hypothetical protein
VARTFTKVADRRLTISASALNTLMSGKAAISVHVWIKLASFTTAANDNRIINTFVAGSSSGHILNIDPSGFIRVAGRSQSADGLQARAGTSAVTTGSWRSVGGVWNYTADTITPYYQGAAENSGAVTFGASTYTPGASPNIACVSSDGTNSTATEVAADLGELAIWGVDIGSAAFAELALGIPANQIDPTNLLGYWVITGTASPELDSSGNGNSATLVGSLPQASTDPPRLTRGTAASTLAPLTAAAAGTVPATPIVGASASLLEDLRVATGTQGTGKVAITGISGSGAGSSLAALTTAAAGTVAATAVVGASASTLGPLTSTSAGKVALAGAAAGTLGALTSAAAGVVATTAITGASAPTLAALTSAAVGKVALAGAAAPTLGPLTTAASGTAAIAGTSAVTLGALTTSAAGTVGTTAIIGAAATTLASLTSLAVGHVLLAGTGQATLGALTSASTGAVGTTPIVGASASTLDALTQASAATLLLTGASATTLDPLTTGAVGVVGSVPILGAGTATFVPLTSAAIGTLLIQGRSGGGALLDENGDPILDESGNPILDEGASSLSALTMAATGIVAGATPITGTAATTLSPLTSAGVGTITTGATSIAGTAATTLGPLTVVATGTAPLHIGIRVIGSTIPRRKHGTPAVSANRTPRRKQ